jgi:dihydrolipoamide dehydrogenase
MKQEEYDVCIIGGGPAGYAAAMRALDFDKKVLLIEKNKLGGAGLYDGALASKSMWEVSEKIRSAREIAGQENILKDISFQSVMETVNAAIAERKFQLTLHIQLLRERLENKELHYERGFAKIKDPNTIEIETKKGIETVKTKNIIIATGSSPRKIPNIQVDEAIIMTSDGICKMDKFPKSIVIVGAGVIGCEYATIFSNIGLTKVYLIDRGSRILPFEDDDVVQVVADNFKEKGVTIHNEASLKRLEIIDGEVEYEVEYPDGRTETIHVEKALLSVGRIPNTQKMGLEDIGLQMKPGGYIVESNTQTSISNIYSAGDVNGRIALVNMAETEARHAVERMFGQNPKALIYDNICSIMFVHPEVAAVGINEKQARQMKIPYRIAKIDYSCIARSIAMRKSIGFFKILVSNDEKMKVLGMRAVGEHASSAIQAVALLIYMNKGIDDICEMLHPHPSIIEGIQEAFRMLKGNSVYKPGIFQDKLKCYHWEPEMVNEK